MDLGVSLELGGWKELEALLGFGALNCTGDSGVLLELGAWGGLWGFIEEKVCGNLGKGFGILNYMGVYIRFRSGFGISSGMGT